MCYEIEVLEYNEDKAIITVGESKFIAYHDTDVSVEEGFDDCWTYRDWETDRKSTRLNSSHSAKSRMPSSA